MGMTCLVTGGLGFIGSHFVRLVLRERPGTRVVNVDKVTYAGNPQNLADVASRQDYVFVRGDIADRSVVHELFLSERPDVVVNFAAESHVDRSILDPGPCFRSNLEGVRALLEAAREHPVSRFVQISTDEVYGDIPEDSKPVDESAPVCPSSPYSASKAAADLVCGAYRRTYGVPVVTARPANNYGPNQFPEKLIPLIIRNALSGRPLPVYGDGRQRRDWIYVEDNVRGILSVMENGEPGSVYNVSTGREHENLEVIQALCDVLAEETEGTAESFRSLIEFVEDRPGHDRRYATDPARIREELGWRAEVGFEDGLRRTVRWYLSNEDWVDRVLSGEYREYYEMVYDRSWGRQRG